jgi:hypothetical protein
MAGEHLISKRALAAIASETAALEKLDTIAAMSFPDIHIFHVSPDGDSKTETLMRALAPPTKPGSFKCNTMAPAAWALPAFTTT